MFTLSVNNKYLIQAIVKTGELN